MRYLFVFLLVGLISCGNDATGDATRDTTGDATRDATGDATRDTTGDATRDATGDATRDATGDAKNEIAKQPNCKDIDGFQTADISLIPNDYTGVAFKCVDGKVIWLDNYKDGKLEGLCRTWHENGQLKWEDNYKDGNRISAKCFDEDGNLIKCD